MLEGMQHAPREHQLHKHPCLQLKLVPRPGLGGRGAGGREPAAPLSRDPALGGAVHPRSWLGGPSLVLGAASCPHWPAQDARRSPPSLDLRSLAGGPHFKGCCALAPGVSAGVSQQLPACPLCDGDLHGPAQHPARRESWPAGSGWCRSQGPSQDSECCCFGLMGVPLSVCELQVRLSLSKPAPAAGKQQRRSPHGAPGPRPPEERGLRGLGHPLLGVSS